MPSKEHNGSSVVSLRLPDALLEHLDRYLDWMECYRGEKSSRNHVMRQALTQWLEAQEDKVAMTHPDALRRRFHAVYTSLRSGQDEVDIYRLRQLLDWPGDRFDAMLEQLRAESQVALRIGDASGLSDAERHQSYAVNGQLYLRLCWQE